jgi:hypothetical protein
MSMTSPRSYAVARRPVDYKRHYIALFLVTQARPLVKSTQLHERYCRLGIYLNCCKRP